MTAQPAGTASPTQQRDLAAAVFGCLAAVLRERAADLPAFVASGYSFESWLLWEWAARCWRRPEWKRK